MRGNKIAMNAKPQKPYNLNDLVMGYLKPGGRTVREIHSEIIASVPNGWSLKKTRKLIKKLSTIKHLVISGGLCFFDNWNGDFATNGQKITRKQLPYLYDAFVANWDTNTQDNFQLPDHRGEFLRHV